MTATHRENAAKSAQACPHATSDTADCSSCETFVCASCSKRVDWELGACDNRPDWCDDCWASINPVSLTNEDEVSR